MKIFLRKVKSGKRAFNFFAFGLVVALALCVAVSQIYLAFSGSAVKVSSEAFPQPEAYVDFAFDKLYGADVYILCNGKKFTGITNRNMRIPVEKNTVVEIYNQTFEKVQLKINGFSENLSIICDESNISADSGITYICRCIYTD